VLSLEAPAESSSDAQPTLKRLKVLQAGYPLDNLSLDKRTGDIYGAAFTNVLQTVKSFEDPLVLNPPSGVLRIRRLPGEGLEYEIEKVLEDNGSFLPGSTVAVHDAGVPERFFMGGRFHLPFLVAVPCLSWVGGHCRGLTSCLGVYSPFITICEKV